MFINIPSNIHAHDVPILLQNQHSHDPISKIEEDMNVRELRTYVFTIVFVGFSCLEMFFFYSSLFAREFYARMP